MQLFRVEKRSWRVVEKLAHIPPCANGTPCPLGGSIHCSGHRCAVSIHSLRSACRALGPQPHHALQRPLRRHLGIRRAANLQISFRQVSAICPRGFALQGCGGLNVGIQAIPCRTAFGNSKYPCGTGGVWEGDGNGGVADRAPWFLTTQIAPSDCALYVNMQDQPPGKSQPIELDGKASIYSLSAFLTRYRMTVIPGHDQLRPVAVWQTMTCPICVPLPCFPTQTWQG